MLKAKRFFPSIIFVVFLVLSSASAFSEEKWEEVRASHFFIYYKTAPRDFVKTVEKSAEEYYDEITSNLGFRRYEGWSFDDRAKIYIYNDRDDYVNAFKELEWSSGLAETRNKIIRTFPSAHGFFDSTLPHELGHIIFREFVGFRADVPLWFEEGVAMFQEKAKRWGAHGEVKKAIQEERFIPLEQLSRTTLTSSTPRPEIDLFYAEAASVIYYLINEFGDYRFVQLCQELKEGIRFEQALKKTYNRIDSIEDLNRLWMRYLESH